MTEIGLEKAIHVESLAHYVPEKQVDCTRDWPSRTKHVIIVYNELVKRKFSDCLADLEFDWHWLLDIRKTTAIPGVYDRRCRNDLRIHFCGQHFVDVGFLRCADGARFYAGAARVLIPRRK